MAQYGRNYYGMSYYGINGVFGGQFVSDITNLATPLTNIAPSDGKLYLDLVCSHPRMTYTYPNEIFIRSGNWTGNASSDPSFVLRAELVAKTLVLNYKARVDGAIINLNVKTYVGTDMVYDSGSIHVDTMGGASYTVNCPKFGLQVVTITNYSSEVFEFVSLDAMTTDIQIEFKSLVGSTWSQWAPMPLTAAVENITENGYNNVYKYNGSTSSISGCIAYQFRAHMTTSDNESSPEVISIDVHTASTSDHSSDGQWKMTVDLTTAATSVDSVVINVTEPDGTKQEIRSRTSNIDGNWTPWSLPYTTAPYRAILNYKADQNIKTGYIMTPLIAPENLTNWISFKLAHLLNSKDTLTGSMTPGSNILVEVVNETYNPLTPTANDVLASFTYTDIEQAVRNISFISIPVKLKINFTRTLNVASPAIEGIATVSSAYYREFKVFGPGLTDYKGLGAAVYGNNTGIDTVYTDGDSRLQKSNISYFGFTMPTGVEDPEYVIEIDPTFASTYGSDEVDIYWNSNGTKSVHLNTGLTDDYIVCKVKEISPTKRIKKHNRYGSGIVTVLSPNYVGFSLTSTFTPALDNTISYAYYVRNGFSDTDINNHIDIRWASEYEGIPVNLPINKRRNISYTLNDKVYVSIITGGTKGLVDWSSEEKIFSGSVNVNDVQNKYTMTITDLPEIEQGVIINPDPTQIPYRIEVVEGSVMSNGERKPENRITGTIRYLYGTTQPSLATTVEVKAEVVRGTGTRDYLPKAMVKAITGVYSIANQASPYYTSAKDYDYSIPVGSMYSNVIDWSKGIAGNNGALAPTAGSTYYVTFTYDKVVTLRAEFSCDYNEYELSPQVYRSPAIEIDAECSPVIDYISDPLVIDNTNGLKLKCGQLSVDIDPSVDQTTLKYVVYDNNVRVRTYVDGNTVVGTLDSRDPRESWTPYVDGGYYYIGKQPYYVYTNPTSYKLGASLIPIADNIEYISGHNGIGILLQQGTTNLLSGSELSKTNTVENVFVDTFAR